MSEGIEARLRHHAEKMPDETACVYAGDVIEVVDELQAALAAANKRVEDLQATADQWKSEAERLRQLGVRQQQEIETLGEMADAVERLREIGRVTGCDHVDDPDGRTRIVRCVEEVIAAAEQENARLREGIANLFQAMETIPYAEISRHWAMSRLDALLAKPEEKQ